MDFTGLAEVQDAIRELGIPIEEEKDVFKALGGLLHLGQVRFSLGWAMTPAVARPWGRCSPSLMQLSDMCKRL